MKKRVDSFSKAATQIIGMSEFYKQKRDSQIQEQEWEQKGTFNTN